MLVFVAGTFSAAAQSAGFNTTYIVLQVNGGPQTYYDLQATTANPDFNGTSLGSFCRNSGSGLLFLGAEHNVYKCGGCDLQSSRIFYRIYPTGSPAGSFISNDIGYSSGSANGCGGEDQMWSNTGYNTNLLSGLGPGTYSLEVYSDATVTCSGGTVYAGNNGANYIASFTIVENTTYYADADGDGFGNASVSQSTCTGAPANYVANDSDCDDTVVMYLDDDGDGFGSDTMVACGVTNSDDCDDTLLQYVDADGDGFGSTTFAGCGVDNNDDCDDTMLLYVDEDEDGFGSTTFAACEGVTTNTDCNDLAVTYQDNDEDGFGSSVFAPCGVSNNDDCNDNLVLYTDLDFDGFGTDVFAPCAGASNSLDCDDDLVTFTDDDEDGFGSEVLAPCGPTNSDDCDDTQVTYADADGDGWGSTTPHPCGATTNTDCDDNNEDLVGLFSFYVDVDGDGFGTGGIIDGICAAGPTSPPDGYSEFDNDCDDANFDISPGSDEVYYNGIDDNCDGNLDEGNQILTQVNAGQCGMTLSNINQLIAAVSQPNSTMYRFEVTNTSTNAIQIIERPLQWFSLTMLNSYDYATTYSIRVQIQRNGIWLGYYGPSCLISTPAVLLPGGPAQISAAQCGGTLSKINSLIACTNIQNVTGYRFRITNLSDPEAANQVQTIDRPLHWFSLTMLPSYTYGTTYSVEVAVKTTGDFSDYGTPCTISTPAVPGISNCGNEIASSGSIVSTTSLGNVTSYKFELTNNANNQVTVIERPLHWFKFSMVPGYVAGAQYAIRVAVMTSGLYSGYGSTCQVTAPAAARQDGDVEAGIAKVSFEAIAYPNPFITQAGIDLTTSSRGSFNIQVYDMTGRLIDSQNYSGSGTIMVGESYPSGVYNVIVNNGTEVKSLRIVKR